MRNRITIIGFTLVFLWLSFITGIVVDTRVQVKRIAEENDVLFDMVMWELIRREGIRLTPYYCPSGHRTIAGGVRYNDSDSLTLPQALELTKERYLDFYRIVEKEFPDHTRNEKLAIALFAHNIGINRLKQLGQWDRMKNRSDDHVKMWQKYVYYYNSKKKRYVVSENLKEGRTFEIALYQSDTLYLDANKDFLKGKAEKKIENLVQQ